MKTMKKAKTANAQYVAEAQIVATISGDTREVTLTPRDMDPKHHAVFSLSESNGFQRGLAEKILHMARASRSVKYYHSQRRPSERAVALQYLRSMYPGQTPPRLFAIQSCYTPTGWTWPAPAGEQCRSYAFFEAGLNIASDNKNLILRFCVSVHIRKTAQ